MKYLLLFSLVFAACQSTDKKSPVEGSWEFEKNELYPGVVINRFQDSLLRVVEKQQAGLTLKFTGSNFTVTQLKDGREEKMGNQPFEISEGNKSLILKNSDGRADDVFPIVLLNDSIFKLNMFNSKEGYLIFRKRR